MKQTHPCCCAEHGGADLQQVVEQNKIMKKQLEEIQKVGSETILKVTAETVKG